MSRLIEFRKKLGTFFGLRIEIPLLIFIRFIEKLFIKNIRYYLFRKMSPLWGGIVVPIKAAIHPSIEVTTSQEIIEIAKRSGVTGIVPCFCRTNIYHNPECKAPVKTCIVMGCGKYIKEITKTEIFSEIPVEEIENLLKKADDYGLVHQLIHFPGPDFFYVICNCCDCCCAALSTYKRFGNHLKVSGDDLFLIKPSNFIARVDLSRCNGCAACLARCKFYAIELKNNKSFIIEANCKGCGLCATGCPTGARKLFPREKS
ncbi:MAG TPA: 4Fe-4S binding protein [Candidatus Deferrimicrobium sp.]|nr:4Fe-4S binding protein [Candidatus Deferrimicrobium sp.]